MKLLADNPVTSEGADQFGFAPFAEILGNAILETEPESLPFTIGVFGEWGTGKTSLLRMLREWLEARTYKTVWFNPWKYDNKEELWSALIRSILVEIHEKSRSEEIRKDAFNILKNTAWFGIKLTVSRLTGGMVSEESLEKVKDNIASQSVDKHDFINNFELKFSKLVKGFVREKGKLIIFIDDLDRCIPENAITVLESIKLYLDNSQCIFVVGMDRKVVELGIQYRYKDILLTGSEYLEKIIQLPFFLPPVQFGKLRETLESQAIASNYSSAIWDLLRYGLGGNPRKAKRFVNSFYMAREALQRRDLFEDASSNALVQSEPIKPDDESYYLAKVLVIQLAFIDFYEFLLTTPSGWQDFDAAFADPPEEGTALWPHFDNKRLKKFMQSTHGEGFAKAPSPATLEHLLRFTSIFGRKTAS